ncbi:MAG: nucleotidyltransferase family protein [Candidatus Dormibacteria bacterium]
MATYTADLHDLIAPRTLRRAASLGLVRRTRSRGRPRVAEGEAEYLRDHWEVLAALRTALRTDRSVAAAVLFGSFARGDDDPGSDVDIAVLPRGARYDAAVLRETLSRVVHRHVDVVDWGSLLQSPEMALAVAKDGRPLVDRVAAFAALRNDRENARRRAARLRARQWRQIERLWGV